MLIVTIFHEKKRPDSTETHLLEMLHQLLQRLHCDEALNVEIVTRQFYEGMAVNNVEITGWLSNKIGIRYYVVYLCSLILVELQFCFASVPNEIADKLPSSTPMEEIARAFDDLLRKYHTQRHAKSLERLCTQRIRNCMKSFDDESFLSLPVPPCLRR